MRDIFISYSSHDREQAQMLTEMLASAGLSVWIDQAGIGAATRWSGEISKAITDCKALIVLLSHHLLIRRMSPSKSRLPSNEWRGTSKECRSTLVG